MSTDYCTFYIVRHAESEGNLVDTWGGDFLLTRRGEQQAKKLFQQFQSIHFDAAFSSDLLRAKKTAEILTLEKKLTVTTIKALRERHYGSIEGKKSADIQELLSSYAEKTKSLEEDKKIKSMIVDDMEAADVLVTRFITFLREVAVGYIRKTILIVSHGDIMRHLLLHLGYAHYEELLDNAILNTGYIKLRSDGIDFFVDETQGITLVKNKG